MSYLDFQKSKDMWIVHIPHTAVWNGLSAAFQGSWDSLVSIVTRLWAAWCGVSIPAGARDLSFLQNVHNLGPFQPHIWWASEILCLGVKWSGLSTYLHLILGLRMIGTTSPLPLSCCIMYNCIDLWISDLSVYENGWYVTQYCNKPSTYLFVLHQATNSCLVFCTIMLLLFSAFPGSESSQRWPSGGRAGP